MGNRRIGVGMIGCGVVGTGVVRLLADHHDALLTKVGVPFELCKIAVRDADAPRDPVVDKALLTTDVQAVVGDPDIDIVIEVAGGVDPTGAFVRTALQNHKHVITANKALLAQEGEDLFSLAHENGVDLYFEAAVAGGIPIIRVLREGLASDKITAIRAILNGTSNYILSTMTKDGTPFDAVLKSAQEAGYAEADPSLDVGGGDACHKLAILTGLAFGARVSPEQIPTEGISDVTALDMKFADQFGYVIKPLAIAHREQAGFDVRVHPALIAKHDLLANINGALNAVHVIADKTGSCLLSGPGAGAAPTAASVVSDLVDVARNMAKGSASRVPVRGFLAEQLTDANLIDQGELEARFYLRFSAADRPGVLGHIAGALGEAGVSIEKMVQDGGPDEAQATSIVMLTHTVQQKRVDQAIDAIDKSDHVRAPTHRLRIDD